MIEFNVYKCIYLLIDSVEFGEHDSIDSILFILNGREVDQSLAKFGQLVHRIISNQRLAYKQHQVRVIFIDQRR